MMTLVFACGDCMTPLEGPANPNRDSVLECLSCGQTETFENVRQIVGEFLQDNARDKMGDLVRNVTSRSENLTFSDTHRPKRVYRFISVEANV
jgi:hypothetical protein